MYQIYFGRLIASIYLEYGLKTRIGFGPFEDYLFLGVIFFALFFKSLQFKVLFENPISKIRNPVSKIDIF